MIAKRMTRRRVLAMGGLVAAGGVVGGSAYALRSRGGGNRRTTGGERPVFTGEVPVGLTHIDDAFERRDFAAGEEIDWDNGIFFLQRDGRVEGYRANQASLESQWPVPPDRRGPIQNLPGGDGDDGGPKIVYPFARYESLAGGELIRGRLFYPREDHAVVLHRASGAAFTWDDQQLMVWGVGPYLMLCHIGHLNLERYGGQSNSLESIDFEIVDSRLAVVRDGTMSSKAFVGFDSSNDLTCDEGRDELYYFRPAGDGKSRELVRVKVLSIDRPEPVRLLPDLAGLSSMDPANIWRTYPGPDRRSLRAENGAPRQGSKWLMPFGEAFRRLSAGARDEAGPLLSPASKLIAREIHVDVDDRSVSIGGWRTVVIHDDETGKPLLRVRSANLNRPYFELDRWDGDGALYLHVLGSDAAHLKFDGKSASLERMPGSATGKSGAAPSPGNPDLIALDQVALLDRASGVTVAARTPPGSEAQGLDPWSGRQGEVVFALWTLRSSNQDAPIPQLMLDPVVEFVPFDDEIAFFAKSESDIRDRPLAHASATGRVDTSELLRLVRQTRHEDWNGYTTASPQQGNTFDAPWAHVESPSGAQGWIPIAMLRWAMGKAL